MTKPYTIYAALAEETNDGWVWFRDPAVPARTVVKISNPGTGRVIFCQARRIDDNFLKVYKEKESTLPIAVSDDALVIAEWYRDALGGFETTHHSKKPVSLKITEAKLPAWRSLRASCQHPDIVARVGTKLGVLGAWLGLVGVAPVVLDHTGIEKGYWAATFVAIAVIAAIVGFLACQGTKPPAK